MLNRHNFAILPFVSKEQSRYTLNALQVTKDATIATDGHRLGWVSVSKCKSENYPVVANVGKPTDDFAPFLLERDTAVKIAKSIPSKESIPALNHAAVSQETVDGEVKTTITATDLENTAIHPIRKFSGMFPQYQNVIPKLESAKFQITLSAAYLMEIAKAFNSFNERDKAVLISFTDAESPVRFDARNQETEQAMTVVLMPMRGKTNDVIGSYGWAEREAVREATKLAVNPASQVEDAAVAVEQAV